MSRGPLRFEMNATRRRLLAGGLASVVIGPAGAAASRTTRRQVGLDPSTLDRNLSPGDNFYRYVNAKWLRETPIPDDRPGWSEFARMNDLIAIQVRDILESAVRTSTSPDEQKIGDLYASLMDESSIERLGLTPLKADLDRIEAMRTPADLAAALAALARNHPRDWWGITAPPALVPVSPLVYFDIKDPTRYRAALIQGGLGMPDRDFYLGDRPSLIPIRKAYRDYLTTLFSLAGRDAPGPRAAAVYDLEQRIAQAQRPRAELFAFDKRYNLWTREELQRQAPGLEWPTYLEGIGYGELTQIMVADPDAFIAAAAAARDVELGHWRDYLLARTLASFAPIGPKSFADAHFAFNEHALKGTPEPKPRWKRAAAFIDLAMGQAVGSIYIKRHLQPTAISAVQTMSDHIKAAMQQRLEALQWMAAETKQQALEKLSAVRIEVGGESNPRDFGGLITTRESAWQNMARAARFDYERNLARINQPVDRGEWEMIPHSANGQSNPFLCKLMIAAGLLQSPIYDADADPAVNYGALGYFIAHEFSHVFDNLGSQFDAQGRLRNWWAPADAARFAKATEALATQYDSYEVLPGLHANGKQTLHENVADLGGLTLALDAYHRSLNGRRSPIIAGLSGEQRLFIAYARMWREKLREEMIRRQTAVETHSLGEWRVATVRNLDAWYEAFEIKSTDKLYLPPDQRVHIW